MPKLGSVNQMLPLIGDVPTIAEQGVAGFGSRPLQLHQAH